jgi:hypothetical protein
LNTRSTFRFNARIMPIRAIIVGPPCSATNISTSIAAHHSGASGLRQLGDEGGDVLERDQLAPAYRVGEWRRPAQCRQPSLSTSVLKPPGIRGALPSLVALQTGQGAPGAPQGHACGPSHGFSVWRSQTQPQSSQTVHFIGHT